MPSYFFPCLALAPGDLPAAVETPGAILHRRQWQTSTFDFATLGASHKLHFSWHLLDVFLNACHLEIEIVDADDFGAAQERVRVLQAMLYLHGVSPFIMPVGMSRGLCDYSGINHRDSPALRGKLPRELQSGFASADGMIEGWLHEPSFQALTVGTERAVDQTAFVAAADAADRWNVIERDHPVVRAARLALQTAPMIPDLPSSLLHAWQGIEALFPGVSSEVSFRLALLISALSAPVRGDRIGTYDEVRRSYARRSRAAHGNGLKLGCQDWLDAWNLLILCLSSCLERASLPDEDALTRELLA
jgi:hypothetical protein